MSERARPGRGKQAKRDKGPRGPREVVYDQEIAPLLDRIFELCTEHDIDFVTAFALDEHDGDTTRIAGSARTKREGVECLRVARAIVSGEALALPMDLDAEEMLDEVLREMRPKGRA